MRRKKRRAYENEDRKRSADRGSKRRADLV